ncbi:hypothetical protein Tco_1511293, partial [Tanacetum coccineum]
PLAQVYEIIAAAGITKGSTVQKQIPELEVRLKLIPYDHICMMEAQELWQWMKFNANLLKAQYFLAEKKPRMSVFWRGKLPGLQPCRMFLFFSMIDQSEPHQVLARALRRNGNHLQALMTVYHKGNWPTKLTRDVCMCYKTEMLLYISLLRIEQQQ